MERARHSVCYDSVSNLTDHEPKKWHISCFASFHIRGGCYNIHIRKFCNLFEKSGYVFYSITKVCIYKSYIISRRVCKAGFNGISKAFVKRVGDYLCVCFSFCCRNRAVLRRLTSAQTASACRVSSRNAACSDSNCEMSIFNASISANSASEELA